MTNLKNCLLLTVLLLFSPLLFAEGYEEIDSKSAAALPDGEIVEFFWYGCPHCYRTEGLLNEAGLKERVVKVPAVVRGSWNFAAKMFYTLQEMGLLAEQNARIFDYIHKQKKPLREEADLSAYLAEQGIDEKRFMHLFNSEKILSQALQAVHLTREFAPKGVPSFVVKKQYRTGPDLTGSLEATVELLPELLEK